MDIKSEIASLIKFKIDGVDYANLIIESISLDKGDYCLPCFSFAKTLHLSPQAIAEKISASIKKNALIERCEIVGGYLNFFLNKAELSKRILTNFKPKNLKLNEGKGKVICIDYGSPNLAKYLHIGHLKTIIIGESMARLFTQFGYTVKRLNYIGDYGTPFGKMIGGMFKWGSLEDVKKRGNDALQEYYVRFNKEEENHPELTQYARDIFKKIELKDKEIYPIYEQIIEIGLREAKKMFDILGVKFDDYRGEMYYNQFVPRTIKMLNKKHLLVDSEGAKIVDLSAFDLTPSVMLKNDGTSLYTTRDIGAAIERKKEYNFDKLIYVTDVAQTLNFKQLFKICELLGLDFYKDMEHLAYGRFSLPDGKISSRRGKQAVLSDLLEYCLNNANEIIKDRHFEIEKPEMVAKKVARAVMNYSVLRVERIKDCVFDTEKSFSFDGETAPYMQYTYTRLESVLRKFEANKKPLAKTSSKTNKIEKSAAKTGAKTADYTCFDADAFELLKDINDFVPTMRLSLDKRDTSIVAKRVMDMCKAFNHFYVTNKILDGNEQTTLAKIELVKALKETLKVGFNILCIDPLKEM